jgi:UDPglucose--hexose-1-phosphate uridylyltransferase
MEIMTVRELQESAHRRLNPLTREWVLVSPHRTQRPWRGKVEAVPAASALAYDPSCYLCPGNERSGGKRNPQYKDTFVFENDFPALLRDAPEFTHDDSGLLVARSEAGACRVVCFSPRHDLTMARMTPAELRQVVGVWADECASLEKLPWVRHIQIFENRGALMGASNPHPHCQIWANASLPNEPRKELASLQDYREEKLSCLLCDYLQLELKLAERIVFENDGFVVLAPYWANWPFETLLLSKRHLAAMTELSAGEQDLLGDALRRIAIRYDNLFSVPFPCSMGFHQRPSDGTPHPEWHFHAHYYPPLLRSATIQKFVVGYELLAMPQRDITAESAAERLREAGELHYLDRDATPDAGLG